jgi:flagellar hook-associated protein 2
MAISSAGIGSGLDVDNIVSQLMQLEQRPLLLLAQRESRLTAQLSTLGTVKSAVSSFLDAANALKTAGTTEVFKLASSNAEAVTGSASATAAAGSYSVTVTQLAQAQRLVATGQSAPGAAIGDGSPTTISFSFGGIAGGTLDTDSGTYSGATFTADPSMTPFQVEIGATNNTLEGIRDAINAADKGVTAAIVNDGSGTPWRLTLSADVTGAKSSLKIDVAGNAVISSLLANDPAGVQNLRQTQVAQDAQLSISGIAISRSSNSVSDAIQGVTLKLTAPATDVAVTVSRDNTTITGALKGLVDAYNEVNKTIKTATGKDALMQGDTATTSVLNRLRSMIGSSIGGQSLSGLGVAFQRDGSLKFDSAKAQAAIDADPASAMSAMKAFGDAFAKVATSLSGSGGSLDARTTGISKALDGISKQGDAIDRRLEMVEKRYRAQFSALDAMIAGMQQTSTFLSQQLANLPKTSSE